MTTPGSSGKTWDLTDKSRLADIPIEESEDVALDEIRLRLDPDKAIHIHQMACFVPIVHRRHIIEIGEYEGVAYFYQCHGLTAKEKAWKREKRAH